RGLGITLPCSWLGSKHCFFRLPHSISLFSSLAAPWLSLVAVSTTAVADRFRKHLPIYYSSACQPPPSPLTFSRSRPRKRLIHRILILSQPSAPGSLDLGHALVNQLQGRLPEIGVVMQQLVCVSQIFYLKERSAFFGELLLNSGKRVHAQLPLPSCFLDLVGLVQEMHFSVHPFHHQ